jgi:hypothetical protein
MFSYLLPDSSEIAYLGGHLHSAWISYTGEIVLDVVENGLIAPARRRLSLRWEMNGGRLSGFDARSIYKTT